MLIAALHELYVSDAIATVTKREAIQFISDRHWFDVREEDLEPYRSQKQLTGEPRWHTAIAWARKDSVTYTRKDGTYVHSHTRSAPRR